jgi:tryptophan synthase alpha chain
MGYYNMIFQYNENKFLDKCKKVKVDGLIVVDLPYPENKKFAAKCKKRGINFIQLSFSYHIFSKIKKNYQRLS